MFKFSKKILLAALSLAALATTMISCNSAQEQKNSIVLGTHPEFPPYEFIDEKGQVAGFDIDIAEKIAAMMGKKLIIKQMNFDALILALKSKKIDFLMSGMSITQDRMKEIAMVPYNGEKITEMQLIFWGKVPAGVQSIDYLKSHVVAAQTGTIQESILHHYDDVHHKSLDGIMDLVMDLKYGKSIAALVQPGIGNELKHKYGEIASIPLPLTPENQVLGDGIGIDKNNPEMIAHIESIIETLKENGELEKLQQKWFHEVE
ncbi:MAG: transporter substrate-binding domain-containing protein [Verrucomicrobiota bacterium]|nr:transporter substrate-binding domain-containing protein [Verrucomicrobiota bacterium]